MIVIQNIEKYFEIAITDEIGNFVSGLTVLYELKNSSNDSLIISGTTTEINSVYYFTYTFNTIGNYRLKYITPTYYDNGFYEITVVEDYAKDDDIQTIQSGITSIESTLTDMELKIKYILGLEQHN